MNPADVGLAIGAARAVAAEIGLRAEDAVILQDSNRITVRLRPCDVVARVAFASHQTYADFEVEIVRQLARAGSPVAGLEPSAEPRGYVRDGFVVTFWKYYAPDPNGEVEPLAYGEALTALHTGLRKVDLPARHFTDRVAHAEQLVGSPELTPELGAVDRDFLSRTLRTLKQSIAARGAAEQLLHGEPHPGNLLSTQDGLLFIDFETVCRGPVEFDIAHAPAAVARHYPGVDRPLLRECRVLAMALVAAWRWDRDDVFPNGRQMGIELLKQVRAASKRHGLGTDR